AHSHDTLQTLASRYHVPLWSLAQMNQAPDMAPLAAGQRVIVPRHLVPPATVSRPASRKH
ncbi:MAG TPA: LysM domain-containing protein, partial [Bradyrhizobium sp.]|nr:LysM domain-containing protein [Bradyrhizobium sp.]